MFGSVSLDDDALFHHHAAEINPGIVCVVIEVHPERVIEEALTCPAETSRMSSVWWAGRVLVVELVAVSSI